MRPAFRRASPAPEAKSVEDARDGLIELLCDVHRTLLPPVEN